MLIQEKEALNLERRADEGTRTPHPALRKRPEESVAVRSRPPQIEEPFGYRGNRPSSPAIVRPGWCQMGPIGEGNRTETETSGPQHSECIYP